MESAHAGINLAHLCERAGAGERYVAFLHAPYVAVPAVQTGSPNGRAVPDSSGAEARRAKGGADAFAAGAPLNRIATQ